MKRPNRFTRITRHLLLALGYGLLGVLVAVVLFYIRGSTSGPDLKPWHRAALDEEFTVSDGPRVADLEAYLDLENRLFTQLHQEVYGAIDDADRKRFNRFNSGSVSDPTSYPANWNRTFILDTDEPRAGVLMLHGLSDSPYSMQALAKSINKRGCLVVGLRLPGHGTAPVGLTTVSWLDFTAAVRLAARETASMAGDRPFYLAGYSNGATLAIQYTLAALEGEELPLPDGLLLISPAVAVTPVAALAKWQRRVSGLPGLEKMAWNSINPEYDPFKYNSFAVNAGEQIHRLTGDNTARMGRLNNGSGVHGFPPVLALQSVADATISAPALVDRFFLHLAPNGHEIILFDINHRAEAEALLNTDYRAQLDGLLEGLSWPFDVTVVTNRDAETLEVVARTKGIHDKAIHEEPLGLAWPRGVYSLSHVALPFPADDPVYGLTPDESRPGIHIGRVELRGERGLLAVAESSFMRLRCNPFFPYCEQRVLDFLGLGYSDKPHSDESAGSAPPESSNNTSRPRS